MLSRILSYAVALMLLAESTPVAAQRSLSDGDLLNREHSAGLSTEDRNRFDELKEEAARYEAADQALRQQLLRLPPLPNERNVLQGRWRLEDAGDGGGVAGLGQGMEAGGADAMFRELWTTLQSNPDQLLCIPMFGDGITFASSTYSIHALDGSEFGGSVDYRSTDQQGIVAVTRNWKILTFEIAGPNRIVYASSCALARVGAPATGAAANTPAAPDSARNAAAKASVPPAAGTVPQAAPVAPAFKVKYNHPYKCGNERVEVFYCRNDSGQQVAEIDNFCQVEYPDRPRRVESIPVFASVRKSDLAMQLANCTGPAASEP